MKLLLYLVFVCSLAFTNSIRAEKKTIFFNSGDDINHATNEKFTFDTSHNWVDSILLSLSLEEKVAQLFMISVYSSQGKEQLEKAAQYIEKYNIGGVIFMQGSPSKQVQYTNYLQSKAKIPLLVSIDGEWGLAMRLDSMPLFPRQMMLGSINNHKLIYEMGSEIARQCKRMGIHINFAPDADVNNNPKNPVINSRSFGDDKKQVLSRSLAYMRGMQDKGLLVTAKHFPGHGDTETDSHSGLPIVNYSLRHLENNELYPFRQLIDSGVNGIMVGHLNVPALDPADGKPASLSKPIITDLLVKKYGFNGLVFTDAMNMGAISASMKPEEAALEAIRAGNDIVLFPSEIDRSIARIVQAVQNNELTEAEINIHCKKVLAAKQYVKLNQYTPIDAANLLPDLQSDIVEYINHAVAAEAITVLSNSNNLIPVENVEKPVKVISINVPAENRFLQRLNSYCKTEHINISKTLTETQQKTLLKTVKEEEFVIAAIHGISQYPKNNYGVNRQTVELLSKLAAQTRLIVVVFGNPFSLQFFKNLDNYAALVVGYENSIYAQDYAAQVIMGGIAAQGHLPVTVEPYKSGEGITTKKTRLGYVHPRMAGANTSKLNMVDTVINHTIRRQMTPGAQILCAKNGYVFYNKSFGYHTYDSVIPVADNTIYDLASLTKVLVSTPLLMHLHKENDIDLKKPLSKYLPVTEDKKDVTLIDMLTHQAGFKAWYPFYKITLERDGNYKSEFYNHSDSGQYIVPVAQNMFTTPYVTDSILLILDTLSLTGKKEYCYSDIPFYYSMQLIEHTTGTPISLLADSLFYRPLGIQHLVYRPLEHYKLLQIAPTENDKTFRKQLVHGYVHDQGAALMGGICGHAGLFGNATSVATFAQMLLNEGEYGGREWFSHRTVSYFTTPPFLQEGNRRAIGFDKPEPDTAKQSPAFSGISLLSYGHSGFTGTYLWIDPDEQMVYVFLSNRIHPDTGNNALAKNNIRTNIHRLFYEAFY